MPEIIPATCHVAALTQLTIFGLRFLVGGAIYHPTGAVGDIYLDPRSTVSAMEDRCQ